MQLSLALAKRRARMVAVSLAAVGMVVGNIASVSAASLGGTSLELSDPRTDETGVTYTFSATTGHSATVANCVDISLATSIDGTGAIPGLDTTGGVNLDSSTAITVGSWTDSSPANGILRATNATGEAVSAGNFVWSGITNGSNEGVTYYALLETFGNIDCTSSPIDSGLMAFVYRDGELVTLEIPPTLTFTTTGVAVGQDVWPIGSGTLLTTAASDGTEIDFGTDVTSSANGVSAHDLNITTNASSGYNVYVRQTGSLTNSDSDTIADHTGTNAVPTAFPAAGTEAWGYTTDDQDLAQFANLTLWAGFPTAGGSGGDLVATSSAAATVTETVRVGHQVGIATTTPAGTYLTTIVYTCVATF